MSMITSCTNCGLPIFHGSAGYAGAQCRCGFSAKPNYDHNALADLLKERDQLKAELALANEVALLHSDVFNERDQLKEQLWHSEMAAEAEANRVDELKAECEVVADFAESRLAENLRLKAENSTLREQLDEARELLKGAGKVIDLAFDNAHCDVFGINHNEATDIATAVQVWLEANKS